MNEVEIVDRKSLPIWADIIDQKAVEAIVKTCLLDIWGELDILINNAGVCTTLSLLEVSEKEWDRQFDVNLKGTDYISGEIMDFDGVFMMV